ncbi:MAG: hypothetical protein ABFS14_10120 [Gemmatimonadota bacterium]
MSAIALLHSLSGPNGIRASASNAANYDAVFTRDAMMAGLAGILADDDQVIGAFVRTLEQLRRLQGSQGQIASNYTIASDGSERVSFGILTPKIDATTWYLVGIGLGVRAGVVDAPGYSDSIRAVVRLLDALEYNGSDLIYVPAGGNWADEYLYDGYLLYDQVLRAWALRLLAKTFGEPAWAEKSASISATIDTRYWPRDSSDSEEPAHPAAGLSPTRTWQQFDLAACSLLASSGLLPERARQSLAWIVGHYIACDKLPPAFSPVIEKEDPDWRALRSFHLFQFRNRPHEYHNGGIWPIWLGWLALGLRRAGRGDDVQRLHTLLAGIVDACADYQFEEYLHGLTLEPAGTRSMAYSASGQIFLDAALSPAPCDWLLS